MRKIFVPVFFLVFAAACTRVPSTNNGNASNANSAAEKSTVGISEAEATGREKGVWDALKKKDYDAFSNMLAADYIEVLDDGVHDKAATSTTIKTFAVSDATFSDWKVLPIDKAAVIVTYNLNLNATNKGTAVKPGPYHVSSGWVNRDGKWLAIYYQETLATSGPPSPQAASSPAAKSAATPAAKTAEATTGPDPVANEKMVWDALKSRNYDAFAAFLAPDSVEVEPDGLYDKAGTTKGVSTIDSSKTTQSEWKTAKFDNDASLVTYLVTMPGAKPDKERHSTVWVNRGGKWMALFHQGTPVAPPGAEPPPAAGPASKAPAKPELKPPAKPTATK